MGEKSKKKIGVGITIGVSVTIIGLLINAMWNDYAKVGYQLSGPKWVYSGESVEIDLKLKNTGNIDIVPTSTVYVVNATIQRVSIPKVAEYQLSKYCYLNNASVTISNLTIPPEWGLAVWASVYFVPNEDVTSFRVYSEVSLPHDLLHPKSKTVGILPYELTYTITDHNAYKCEQLESM